MPQFEIDDVVDYHWEGRVHRAKVVGVDGWVGAVKLSFSQGQEQYWADATKLTFVRKGKPARKKSRQGATS